MNKVILLGRLTKNPEIRYSQNSKMKVANFTLAVNRRITKQDEQQADFIKIIAFSNQAEFTEKYLKQGQQICICGKLQNRSWEDENSQKHFITEVIAFEIYFADSPKKADESILTAQTTKKALNPTTNVPIEDEVIMPDDTDDLPF